MNALSFFVASEPKGQPRPKAFRRGAFTGVYNPKTADNWKSCMVVEFHRNKPPGWRPIEGPLKLTMEFLLPRPKSHYRSNGNLKADAPNFCPRKPDWDNLGKTSDCLTGLAWMDDNQVVFAVVTKRYAASAERSGCHVRIEPVPEI